MTGQLRSEDDSIRQGMSSVPCGCGVPIPTVSPTVRLDFGTFFPQRPRIHGGRQPAGPGRESGFPVVYSVVRLRSLDGRAALSSVKIGRMGSTGRMGDSKRGQGQASPRWAAKDRTASGRPVFADPFCYLNNFKTVLSSLEERYRDLLSARPSSGDSWRKPAFRRRSSLGGS